MPCIRKSRGQGIFLNLWYLLPMPESRITGEVLQQDFSGGFVLIPDKAEPEQETAECIFVIVYFRWLA